MIRYPHSNSWSCGEGWHPLINELIEKIVPLTEELDINVNTIKEKYGTLAFYVDSATDKIYDLINEYETKSCMICEVCGKEGRIRRELWWIRTLCDDHFNKIPKSQHRKKIK